MTNAATPVAAWYPDPSGHAELRWWDGTHWTAEVRSATAPGAALDAPSAPTARGAHVPETASPAASSISMTPAEERTALYASLQAAHSADMSASHASSPSGPVAPSRFDPGQFAAGPAGASESPDRYRMAYEEKTYQAWRKNKAATSALVFAGINLGLMVFAFFQHYSPYYRIVPSVIGITAALLALRQARQTDTGLVKSVVALIVNVVVGAVAAFALLQLALGLSAAVGDGVNEFVDTPNAVYSDVVESSIHAYASEDQGKTVVAVDCPASMRPEVGLQYDCTETLGDGSTLGVTVRVTSTDGAFEYAVEGMP